MPHMIPHYSNAKFATFERNHETHVVPEDVLSVVLEDGDTNVEIIEGKWWARLSAPGYMDCTDWDGPHDTLDEAKEHLTNTFMVDADTGEDLEA